MEQGLESLSSFEWQPHVSYTSFHRQTPGERMSLERMWQVMRVKMKVKLMKEMKTRRKINCPEVHREESLSVEIGRLEL